MKKIKYCPLCGNGATVYKEKLSYIHDIYGYGVMCNTPFCCRISPKYKTEEDAITEWNTRVPVEEIVEMLKWEAFDMSLENPDCKAVWLDKAIEIVQKEL